jgi:leader peptidase (prepilin peptidase)/N-methyltransferase
MGLGDVKMLAMTGAFLGWHGVLVTLFCGALSGAVAGIALMRWGSHDMRSKLPFGTFLALGGLVALFAGEALLGTYLRLL